VLDRLRGERGDRGGGVLQLVGAAQAGDEDRVARGLLALRRLRGFVLRGCRDRCQRRERKRSAPQRAQPCPCPKAPPTAFFCCCRQLPRKAAGGNCRAYFSRPTSSSPATDSALATSTAAAAPLAPALATANGRASSASSVGTARSRKFVSALP